MHRMKQVLIGVGACIALLLLWGLLEPYFIDRQDYTVALPNLPQAWAGHRIGLIADLQVGMWLDNTRAVKQSVHLLIEERPAAVVIAGDFVYGPSDDITEDIEAMVALIRPLVEADIPTFAVLGNHDYGMDDAEDQGDMERARLVESELEAAGVEVLQNEAVALTLPSSGTSAENSAEDALFYLVGIGARWPDLDRPAEALIQVPARAPRLVMMHNPNSFEALPASAAPLAVAGHTHGGQIRVPFLPDWSWLDIVKEDEIHVDGWINGAGQPGNRLYVNRGIGFSIVPLRIFCPPEVTFFTFQSSD